MEMLHQDLRPDNIMIDKTGTAKIIDFGSTRIAGIADDDASAAHDDILGTAQYTAPEYFLGEGGSPRSDIFSLGVIAYQMLTGRLPYGAAGGEDPDEIAAAKAALQVRARRQPRNPGLDRRRAAARPCIRIRCNATTNCPSSCSTCGIPTRNLRQIGSAAARARPAAVLEMPLRSAADGGRHYWRRCCWSGLRATAFCINSA